MQPETRYVRGPEGHVAYQVLGSGPRDIVFVPDHPNNIEIMWEEPAVVRFFERLATMGRVICFDKRGTGISDPVPLGAIPTIERWMDDPDPDSCSVPRAEVEAAHAETRALVARVVRDIADPDLRVVDPTDALCDAQRCRAVIDGRLMYLDDNHLSPDGSKYVWARIQPRNLRANAVRRWQSPHSAYRPSR